MNPQVSIIIVSYQVKDLLLSCLSSIPAGELYEIIVIDNNSADGTCDAVQESFPDVVLVRNDDNRGFSAANNQGIEMAGGKFILLLNPDTECQAAAIESMVQEAEKRGRFSIVGPQLLNPDGSLQESCWKFSNVWDIVWESLFFGYLKKRRTYKPAELQQARPVDFISGAAMLFRKELTARIGKLDESLFWMEDVDLCRRTWEAGGEVIYFPLARIVHHSGQSAKKNRSVAISNQLISKLKFVRKYDGSASFAAASAFCLIQIISRMLIFSLAGMLSGLYRAKASAYIYTAGRYFRYILRPDSGT